jgi:hypothetical protein
MIGTVLNFAKSGDGGSDSGVIRGEDGARYRFAASDWASPGSAIAGDVVDFEIKDGVATEIYVTKKAQGAGGAATAVISGLAGQITQKISGGDVEVAVSENPVLAKIQQRPAMIAAIFAVLASFLPYISLPPIPIGGFEGGGVNLYSAISNIWSLLSLAGPFVPGSISVPLRLIALLIAIPMMSGYLAFREYQGTATEKLRFQTGLLALIGPLGIPIVAILLAILFSGGGSQIGSLLDGIGGGGGRVVSNFFGYGLILMMMCGGVLIGIRKGWDPLKLLAGSGAFYFYLVLNHG